MPFGFRLRFRTAKNFTIAEDRMSIAADEHGPEFAVAAAADGTLQKSPWLSVRMGGFETAEAARAHALEIRDHLLLLGVLRMMGFDFGRDRTTASVSDFFRKHLEEQRGCHIRDNVHGLDIFELDPDRETRFFSVSASGTVTESPAYFANMYQQIRAARLEFTERHRLCLELINDSLFPASPDAQLLIRVSAMEVLCKAGARPEAEQAVLSALVAALATIQTTDESKKTIREMLHRGMQESIGQACRRKVVELLGKDRYEEFSEIYGGRSRLVHQGKGRGENVEIAGKALLLAIALVRADLKFSPVEPVIKSVPVDGGGK